MGHNDPAQFPRLRLNSLLFVPSSQSPFLLTGLRDFQREEMISRRLY